MSEESENTLSAGQSAIDRVGLIAEVRETFQLDWQGIHGFRHWLRVRHHGLSVARLKTANAVVVELFALLHDSCRIDDDYDPGHGPRAAAYTAALNGRYFELSPGELQKLTYAIELHSDGHTSVDPTIQSCWDADRLDLGRVGIKPRAKFLSAEAAQFVDDAEALRKNRLEQSGIVPDELLPYLRKDG